MKTSGISLNIFYIFWHLSIANLQLHTTPLVFAHMQYLQCNEKVICVTLPYCIISIGDLCLLHQEIIILCRFAQSGLETKMVK